MRAATAKRMTATASSTTALPAKKETTANPPASTARIFLTSIEHTLHLEKPGNDPNH